ncbi:hypothetical protein MKW92_014469, partial [Papaver armeniacum]
MNLINTHFTQIETHCIKEIYISKDLGADKLIWTLSKKGVYTTKSFHKMLADNK